MAWHLTENVDDFWSAGSGFLRSRPVENSLPLTLTDTLRTRDRHYYGPADPLFGWWESAGEVTGVCLQTPPHPLIIAGAPSTTMPELATLLAERPLPGLNAPAETAEAFGTAWRELTGASVSVRMQTRLFRLDGLTPPSPAPPGRARVADVSDRELLVSWLTDFESTAHGADSDAGRVADDKLTYGGLTLWEVDGTPVSLAGNTRPEGGVVRVAPVYTPPELRGRGYGAAVTSAVSQAALDAGADEVVLFTDLANPTSNALYQRLGYRPIETRVVLELAA
jgi:GNAT superfamily N-acetyltransferase